VQIYIIKGANLMILISFDFDSIKIVSTYAL